MRKKILKLILKCYEQFPTAYFWFQAQALMTQNFLDLFSEKKRAHSSYREV